MKVEEVPSIGAALAVSFIFASGLCGWLLLEPLTIGVLGVACYGLAFALPCLF